MKLYVFPEHPELEGRHAPFPASTPSWLNYDDEKIKNKFYSDSRKELGTELHAFAASYIRMSDILTDSMYEIIRCFKSFLMGKYDRHGDTYTSAEDQKKLYGKLLNLYKAMDCLPDTTWRTLYLYVNDCVTSRMTPEAHLFYTWDFFGTVDAISYDIKERKLNIFDLKTGSGAVSFDQLCIYAAYACLENKIDPKKIKTCELRIYQNGDVKAQMLDNERLEQIISIIQHASSVLEDQKNPRR